MTIVISLSILLVLELARLSSDGPPCMFTKLWLDWIRFEPVFQSFMYEKFGPQW